MNIANVITAICSLLFIMIGADKFLFFMDPPCSLTNSIPTIVWKILGVMQLAGGVLIWLPSYRKYVSGFFVVFMLFFTAVHLINNTYDVGGALSMAVLLGLLTWNPIFIRGKNS